VTSRERLFWSSTSGAKVRRVKCFGNKSGRRRVFRARSSVHDQPGSPEPSFTGQTLFRLGTLDRGRIGNSCLGLAHPKLTISLQPSTFFPAPPACPKDTSKLLLPYKILCDTESTTDYNWHCKLLKPPCWQQVTHILPVAPPTILLSTN
jgi:hypothetical protein